MGELHAKVPMVAIGDPGLTAGKIEVAEHNAGLWAGVQDHSKHLSENFGNEANRRGPCR